MRRWSGPIGFTVVLLLSIAFAAMNGGQHVVVRLGFATLYRVPLTVVVFTALILGMVGVLIAGIASDLRVRRILRERLSDERDEEQARLFVDRNQTSLFPGEDPDPREDPH